jgi:hypothetical protein
MPMRQIGLPRLFPLMPPQTQSKVGPLESALFPTLRIDGGVIAASALRRQTWIKKFIIGVFG